MNDMNMYSGSSLLQMKKLLADLDVALLSIVMMALHKGQVV
jgi:hypothetical protein